LFLRAVDEVGLSFMFVLMYSCRYNNGGDGPDFKKITDDVAQVAC
jgi:hypothetical protein